MLRRCVSVLLLLTTFGLAACGSDDDNGPRPTATPTTVPTATSPPATATAVATATVPATVPATSTVPPTATLAPAATNTASPSPTATEVLTPTPTVPPATAEYPAQQCASEKQAAAAAYCEQSLSAWADWDVSGDAATRDAALQTARTTLADAWAAAETAGQAAGVDCSAAALAASAAQDIVDAEVASVVTAVNDGLDLESSEQAECGAALLGAAAQRCGALLGAESRYLRNLGGDPDETQLAAERAAAAAAFSTAWAAATAGTCPTGATESGVAERVDAAAAALVLNTVVAPGVAAATYTTISPTGTTTYLGKELTPVCMDGSPYHFFVRRGTVNKLVMYYQGGGACWEALTCTVPTCDPNVQPDGGDNPNGFSSGFADLDNPDNPFRDWHAVFVSYCSCDIHFGDAGQDYPAGDTTLRVEHRGFHNAQIAEKWAREHFVNPEEVFVTGSSAGAYGAFFNAVPLQRAWPASRFNVLADAGNGVITPEFLAGPFTNWNFEANLPTDIPGLREAIENGTGIPAYTEAVAEFFPQTNWAHYTTAFDGGSGGQTGFYNIMLNDNFPLAALRWWDASCAFTSVMRAQAVDTAERVPDNYRYYIGTGSRHTMWGADKVYDDTTGGVPTVVEWLNAMLASRPGAPDPGWTNVECENCGLLLAGDPRPTPLEPPFQQIADDVVIVCE